MYVSLSRFIFCYPDPDQLFLKWIQIRTRPNDTDPTGSGSGFETLHATIQIEDMLKNLKKLMYFAQNSSKMSVINLFSFKLYELHTVGFMKRVYSVYIFLFSQLSPKKQVFTETKRGIVPI